MADSSEAGVISSRNEVTVGSLQSAVSWHASFPGTARRGLFINKAHSERRGAAAMLDRQLPHQNRIRVNATEVDNSQQAVTASVLAALPSSSVLSG